MNKIKLFFKTTTPIFKEDVENIIQANMRELENFLNKNNIDVISMNNCISNVDNGSVNQCNHFITLIYKEKSHESKI